ASSRKLSSGHADDDFPFSDPGSHRDRVIVLMIGDARFPNDLAGLRIQRFETSIDHRGNNLALIDGQTAIYDAATDFRPDRGLIDVGIPSPTCFGGPGIDRKDDAPVRDSVDGSVPRKRRCFLRTTTGTGLVRPCEAEPGNVGRVDLSEGAVACFTRSETVSQPFLASPAGSFQRSIVDSPGLWSGGNPYREGEETAKTQSYE